jgi:hypothetical protein
VGELAVAAADLAPLFGHRQDLVDLPGHQSMHGEAARCPVLECADLAPPVPPAVRPIVGHTEQPARPGVRGAGGDRLVDQA